MTNKTLLLAFCLSFLSVVLAPSGNARAGGYFISDRGVRAFSKGGAFVVGCDDLSALWYNPATLAGQEGTRLHIDAALLWYHMEFQRYTVPKVGEEYDSVENNAPPMPIPSFAVSSDFGLEDFVFAFGAYGPYGSRSEFPEDGASRFALIRSLNLGYFLEAAASWEPFVGMRIGAAFALVTMKIDNTFVVAAYPGMFGGPEDKDLDAVAQYVAEDQFVPTGVFGIWLAPGEWISALKGIELGASFMPGMDFVAKGKLISRLPDHYYYDGVKLVPAKPEVVTRFSFPWVVRAGLRYADPKGRFDVETAFVWEQWSVHDTINVDMTEVAIYEESPTTGDYEALPLSVERHYRDTWSLRLGGTVVPLEWLVLRYGGYFESGSSPDEYYTVATPDSEKIGLSFGVGVVLGAFEIDAGYMHIFQFSKDIAVEDSDYLQTNPTNPEYAVSIGGGKYKSGYDLLGLSLLVRFDEFWK